jgi:hypothetical protein
MSETVAAKTAEQVTKHTPRPFFIGGLVFLLTFLIASLAYLILDGYGFIPHPKPVVELARVDPKPGADLFKVCIDARYTDGLLTKEQRQQMLDSFDETSARYWTLHRQYCVSATPLALGDYEQIVSSYGKVSRGEFLQDISVIV